MKKILFIFFVLFSVHIALGQDDGSTQEPNKFEKFLQNEKVGVLVDYFGELVLHPGMAIGIDYSISKNGWFDLHWTTEVGGYYHKWNHTGLFAKTSIGTRYTTSFSWFMDLNVGAGYLHITFWNGV